MDRTRFNRLWLIFAMVAVALVWAWSEVAQRSDQQRDHTGEPVELLRTEAGCDLAVAPCAAYGAGLGLVASAHADGDGVRWRFKLVGDTPPAPPRLSARLLPKQGDPRTLDVVQVGSEWQAYLPSRVASGAMLRVRVAGGSVPLIADFPLGVQP